VREVVNLLDTRQLAEAPLREGSQLARPLCSALIFTLCVFAMVVGGVSPARGEWAFACSRYGQPADKVSCWLSDRQLLVAGFAAPREEPSFLFTLPLFWGDESQKELFARIDGGDWMRLDDLPTAKAIPQTPVDVALDAMRRGRAMTVRWYWPGDYEPKGQVRVSLLGFAPLLDAVLTTLEAQFRQPRRYEKPRPKELLPRPDIGLPVLRAT
jgi:hypothetical protein